MTPEKLGAILGATFGLTLRFIFDLAVLWVGLNILEYFNLINISPVMPMV